MLLKGKLAEYNIKDAYIIAPNGQKICEFKKHNLHVVGYSEPVHNKLSLDELKKHLYIDTKNPNVIPYVTSYYEKRWGFCLSQNEPETIPMFIYRVIF